MFTLKDIAADVINLTLKNRVDTLKLHRQIPWTLVVYLWNTWRECQWDILGTHVHYMWPSLVEVNNDIFNEKMEHNFVCNLFRNYEDYYW